MYIYIYIHIHTYLYICLSICVYIYIYIYMYVHAAQDLHVPLAVARLEGDKAPAIHGRIKGDQGLEEYIYIYIYICNNLGYTAKCVYR